MKMPIAGVAVLLLLAGLLWWLLPAPLEIEPVDALVPSNVLALVLVRDVPETLEQLSETQLARWLDPYLKEFRKKMTGEEVNNYLILFRQNLVQASGVVHGFRRKENGSFRIDFTIFLHPKEGRQAGLSRYAEEWARRVFGTNSQTLQEGPVRILKGSEEGQLLYIVQMPHYLVVSNTGIGWEQTLETLRQERPSLSEDSDFRKVRHALQETEIFVYFRGSDVLPILPEFGYGINLDGQDSTDQYYALED